MAGCGGGTAKPSTQTSAPTSTSGTPSSTSAGSVGALATLAVDTTNTGSITQYRVSVHDLRRAGPFVTLDFALTCLSATCDPSNELSRRIQSAPSASIGVASAIDLVDPAGSKEYQVVRDSQQRADTSSLPITGLNAGDTIQVWATFPAPPASVTALDVLFGNGGSWIHGVPLTTAPAPDPKSWGGPVTAATPAPFAVPPGSSSTSGLALPVLDVQTAVGNPNGSDEESAKQSTITLSSDVLFAFGKSRLTAQARGILKAVAAKIVTRAKGPVTVTGYTDSIGSASVNIPLSQARARSVVAALTPLTAAAHVTFHASGLGAANPIAPNTTTSGADNPKGRALNRRVTISYAVKAPAPPTPPPAPAPAPPGGSGSASHSVDFKFDKPVSGQSEIDDYTVTAAQIVRTGKLAVLGLTITCNTETPASSDGCDGAMAFAAGTGDQAVPPSRTPRSGRSTRPTTARPRST